MTSPALSPKVAKPAFARLFMRQIGRLLPSINQPDGWRTWLFEILILTAVIVALSVVLQPRVMLMSASPHPLWLPVLAASLVHGTFPGLAAAAIAGLCAWLFGPPSLVLEEDYYDLMFRAFKEPVLWLFAALLLGTYRDRIEAERQKLGRERDQARDDLALVVEHATALRTRVGELERSIVLAGVLPARTNPACSDPPLVQHDATDRSEVEHSVVPITSRQSRHAPAEALVSDRKADVAAGAPHISAPIPSFTWAWACLWAATSRGWECLNREGQESLADPGRLLRHFDQQCRVYDSRQADDQVLLPQDGLLAVPIREGLAPATQVLIVGGGHIDRDMPLDDAIKAVLPVADRLAATRPMRPIS